MRSTAARTSKLVAAGALCFMVMVSPALGQTPGYTLNMSAPPTATVGQPIVIQASGSNPPTDFFNSYLDVHAIPTSVLSTCPDGYLTSHQVADSTYAQGGEAIAIGLLENVDEAGNFSMQVAFSPRVAGRFLLCGYTEDAATGTLARKALTLDVRAPAAPPAPAGGGGGTVPPSPTGGGAPPKPTGGGTPPSPTGSGTPTSPTGGGGTTTPAIRVALSQSYKVLRSFTRFSTMQLNGVPSGSQVTATCKVKRKQCSGKAGRSLTRRNASGRISLTNFTRQKLKAGSVITIKVTRPGARGAVKVVTIRRNRAPLFTTRCLQPGSGRVVTC